MPRLTQALPDGSVLSPGVFCRSRRASR
jgi:hypothetical protein